MEKFAHVLVKNRNRILVLMLVICAVTGLLALKLNINTDMTKYLPNASRMKQGIDVMADEFQGMSMPNTIRVMFSDLSEEEMPAIREALGRIEYVSSVALTGEKDPYTLFTISTEYTYQSPQERAIEREVLAAYKDRNVVVRNDNTNSSDIPPMILITAAIILVIVLFSLSASWIEPFLFLFTIGVAVVINLGTNLILGSISQITFSMSALLQFVLSMDYSIILMNRYRQEKEVLGAGTAAMEKAFTAAFSSVIGSGMTTLIGMFMLVFMQFKIGMDLGLVLAKGVFLSMLCVLTILPGLILLFDKLIEKSAKKILGIPTGPLAAFSFGARKVMVPLFVILFVVTAYTQSKAGITYSLSMEDPIAEIFTPANPVVVLYENQDEEKMSDLCSQLEQMDGVDSISAYATTIGKQMTPEELADFAKEMSGEELVSANQLRMLYRMYGLLHTDSDGETMSIEQLFAYVTGSLLQNEEMAKMLGEEMAAQAGDFQQQLADGKAQLMGEKHSIMMISTLLPTEGEETTAFIEKLEETLDATLDGTYYLIGNSVMSNEMQKSFGRELMTITLLTAVSIFIVVALTFRSFMIPLLLVLLVQCGVFVTITTVGIIGYDMYYLAVLIVQCILMGATVDYGILYTNYYRELRKTLSVREAITQAYEGSIHTILTSSLFVISATGAIGISPADPTIAQICQTIALGTASATLLILIVLPGLLAGADRFVRK